MSRKIALIAAAIVLTACASRPPPAKTTFERASVVTPLTPLNEELTSEVGGVIYEHGWRRSFSGDWVTFRDTATVALEVGQSIRVNAGNGAPLRTRKPGDEIATCVLTAASALVRMAPGAPPLVYGCLVDTNADGTFDIAMFERFEKTFPLSAPLRYTVETLPSTESSITRGAVRRELAYAGVSNGSLRLQYREYTLEGMARPAFSQEVSYVLDDKGGAEVGFRGLRMQVLAATNNLIRYRLTRSMD